MGASQSSNVSSAIANVTNDIANQTTANTQQVSTISQKITMSDCTIITKNYSAKESASTMQSNTQLTSALQKSDVQNNIQQKLLQEAASTVGSMGVGYADASNSASMLVNATTTITNSMDTACNQFANINQSWTCDRSTIIADNVDINLSSSSAFLSDQVLNNNQVAKVVNDISQVSDQKATATVEGLTGFLIGIALIIIALGYSVAKPLNSGSAKIFMVVAILVILGIIIIYMYIKNAPPLFGDDNECLPGSGYNTCTTDCINITNKTIQLKYPPLRYIYDLTPAQKASSTNANLMQMVISYKGKGTENGGYNSITKLQLDDIMTRYNSLAKKLNIEMLPPLLLLPTDPTDPANKTYYVIPDEYLKSGTDPSTSICTPAAFQKHVMDVPVDFAKCPQIGQILNTKQNADLRNDPTIMANLNDDEWNMYLDSSNPDAITRSQFARYVLCDIMGVIPLNIFISGEEFVNTTDVNGNPVTDQAKNILSICYQFKTTSNTDFLSAIVKGGTLDGPVGVCNDNKYKFHHFVRTWGIVIILALFGLLIYMIFKNPSTTQNSSKSTTPAKK
jgi:hypothetical protein